MVKRDLLTGMADREEVGRQVGKLKRRAEKTGKVSAIFGDLDFFSGYNTFGHDVGDEVLRRYGAVASEYVERVNRELEDRDLKGILGSIKKGIRRYGRQKNVDFLADSFAGSVDTVKLFRYSGEETLLATTLGLEKTNRVSEGLAAEVRRARIVPESHPEARMLTISAGYETVPLRNGKTFEGAFAEAREHADSGVEFAKLSGRDGTRAYSHASVRAEKIRSALWNMHYLALRDETKIAPISSILPEEARQIFNYNITLMKAAGIDPNGYREVLGFSDAVASSLVKTKSFNADSIPSEYTATIKPEGVAEKVGLKKRRDLPREAGKVARYGEKEQAVVLVDLDSFSVKNQRYSHAGGDIVLGKVSRVIEEAVREYNGENRGAGFRGLVRKLSGAKPASAVRYGGEEFVVAVAGGVEEGRKFAEKLQGKIRAAGIRAAEGDDTPITASIGVAAGRIGETEGLHRAVSAADDAANYAKLMGKNRIEISSDEVSEAAKIRSSAYGAYAEAARVVYSALSSIPVKTEDGKTRPSRFDELGTEASKVNASLESIARNFSSKLPEKYRKIVDEDELIKSFSRSSKFLYTAGIDMYDTRRLQAVSDSFTRRVIGGKMTPDSRYEALDGYARRGGGASQSIQRIRSMLMK